MLTQEELDNLLNEEGNSHAEDSGDKSPEQEKHAEQESSRKSLSQDDLDRLMEGDDKTPETTEKSGTGRESDEQNIDWSDAFKEAADGGDAAAAKAFNEGPVQGKEREPDSQAQPQPRVNQPEFGELREDRSDSDGIRPELDFLLEIPLDISVELGRRSMKIKELLQLSQGSVVELNKMAGEPADIYVNKKLMAKGEVVVVNEKFGIKLTEIISPAERVKSLA
jgi:flagellar motor switch protein FliN/FliY